MNDDDENNEQFARGFKVLRYFSPVKFVVYGIRDILSFVVVQAAV